MAFAFFHARRTHLRSLVLGLVERFGNLADSLRSTFPERWLLRWNLVECLAKARRGNRLVDTLRAELLAIERVRPDDLPISMGLRYLDEQYPR